ncbi:CRISPR-associated protein Cas4 [Leptotrichia sp. oral taxon 218]|uniref:CRISPR-associated protein Cas4 n=1 Tax=Leptotrichia sp. oral taxon 218 TaxID=712361 RepID=UPI001B8B9CB7|nr:CRISPR-associated protein Cas4 [Leptotrichia sp. oral taxon 218]QUB94870.1 CRISPR-associated protein Cas4 [Leptotrichia sp. oral taxon 218]
MKEFREDEYLMLSGIQHFYFCKRQWCLIHIEQQWDDNEATKEGEYLHENADNPFLKESRQDVFFSRSIPISSKKLGLNGILDVVEFRKSNKNEGIKIFGKNGYWIPKIVEYKRGKEKKDLRDIVQLVAEVICLEETLNVEIKEAFLFYDMTKKRKKIEITQELRNLVEKLSLEMHEYYKLKKSANAENYKNCTKCSLYDICIPKITKKKKNVLNYMNSKIYGDLE